MARNDFVNDLLRSKSPAQAAERQPQGADVTALADGYLDSLTNGLAGLRATLGVLSPEGGDIESVPEEVKDTLDAVVEALEALRDDVDDLLAEHDLEPTTPVDLFAAAGGSEKA